MILLALWLNYSGRSLNENTQLNTKERNWKMAPETID
jgi:hypothetical protein